LRILLINAPDKHSIQVEVPGAVSREVGRMMPMGLLSVYTYLKEHGIGGVSILDAALPGGEEKIGHYVEKTDPDIVAISAYTHNLYDVTLAVREIKRLKPDVRIVIGGPHVNAFPREAAMLEMVDFAIQGDGEHAFLSLVRALDKGDPALNSAGIPGVWHRGADNEVRGVNCEPIRDLDTLPFVDRNALDMNEYYYSLDGGGTSAAIYTTKGCPYKCRFCSTPRESVRRRSVENILEEIRVLERTGIGKFFILDDMFHLNRDRTESFAKGLIDGGHRISWSFRARLNKLDPQLLVLLKRSGCRRIQVGIETGTDEGLEILGKDLTVDQIRRNVRMIRKAGIEVAGYFMLGCPHERTEADVRHTINFAIELNLDYALFGIFTPFLGTPLYEEARESGIIKGDPWLDFIINPIPDFQPPVWDEFLSREQLIKLTAEAYRKFYLRPSYIARRAVKAVGRPGDWPVIARSALSILSLKGGGP
jgi:radical SAM superfamily enzyme YgiQ (UPF0313 family)